MDDDRSAKVVHVSDPQGRDGGRRSDKKKRGCSKNEREPIRTKKPGSQNYYSPRSLNVPLTEEGKPVREGKDTEKSNPTEYSERQLPNSRDLNNIATKAAQQVLAGSTERKEKSGNRLARLFVRCFTSSPSSASASVSPSSKSGSKRRLKRGSRDERRVTDKRTSRTMVSQIFETSLLTIGESGGGSSSRAVVPSGLDHYSGRNFVEEDSSVSPLFSKLTHSTQLDSNQDDNEDDSVLSARSSKSERSVKIHEKKAKTMPKGFGCFEYRQDSYIDFCHAASKKKGRGSTLLNVRSRQS